MSNNTKFSLKDLIEFIFSKLFVKHVGLIIVFYLAIALIMLFWLRFYTNHGQKLVLPDYKNTSFEKSVLDAKRNKFEMMIDDSVHVVGKKGGIIIDQNPKPGSKVKENRKIYVIVTKYSPDKIKLEELPSLYGRNYDTKKNELELIGIKSRIAGYEYDKGEPNYILKVLYRGRPVITSAGNASGVQIDKGSVLDFILSKKSGGMTDLPNLRCMALSQAVFMLESRQLMVGAITRNGVPVDNMGGFVIGQSPGPTFELPMDSSVDLQISVDLPSDCK